MKTKLVHIGTLAAFVVFEIAFLVDLRGYKEGWAETVSFVGVAFFVLGLIYSLWRHEIDRKMAGVTVLALAVVIALSEIQSSNMDSTDLATLFLHGVAVAAVSVFYWLAIKPIKGPSKKVKQFSACSLFANEFLLVVYLASSENILVFTLLAVATAALGLSFWLIFRSTTKA